MRSSTIAKTTINNIVKSVADNDNNEKNVNVFFERKIEELQIRIIAKLSSCI
jgi:hypothetical protein